MQGVEKSLFSIGLVNYKTFELTSICLELIKNAIDVDKVPIWVVDNNSNDDSLDYLRSLDWIHLIERKVSAPEDAYMAHGCALDLILGQVKTDYLLLMHTDTLIYDAAIIDEMVTKMTADSQLAAIGCLQQVYHAPHERIWGLTSRAIKYFFRSAKVALGIKTRPPRLFYETHLKSFCALWSVKLIKKHKMRFYMNERTPGYEMQDQLTKLGYRFEAISPSRMFKCLDHIKAGSVSLAKNLADNHKRLKNYKAIVQKIHK